MKDPVRPRILIVDDEPAMLHTLRRVLGRRCAVVCAPSGSAALEAVKTVRPDVAVVDVRMPEMNGFELTRELRARDPELDVVLMTGDTGEPDATLIQAIEEGAFYFIQKPFDRRVLLALVDRCLELRRLRTAERHHVRQLEEELETAWMFQSSLLPPEQDDLPGVSVSARYRPCSRLAGDLYDYVAPDGRSAAFVIADVVGHGASAAMLTSMVKSAFRSAQTEGYEPSAVVGRLKEAFRPFDPSRFVTLCCGRIDSETGELHYVNAGHPPPILRGAGVVVPLSVTGPLISSALYDIQHAQETVRLQPGDCLVCYTDGVIETKGAGALFGSERLASLVATGPADGAGLLDAVLAALSEFSGPKSCDDDVTLLGIGYRGLA